MEPKLLLKLSRSCPLVVNKSSKRCIMSLRDTVLLLVFNPENLDELHFETKSKYLR
jgi:hypothetical protein